MTERDTSAPTTRERWAPMVIEHVGDAATLIQLGGGKLSAVGGDPGESRKQKPSG